MKLIGKKLFLEPSISAMRGMIAIPSNVARASNMCRVVHRGSGVNLNIKVGDTVICQNGFAERRDMKLGDNFFCTEDNVVAVMRKGKIYPIGKKILFRRDIAESSVNGIVIPENRRMQSLYGRIERFGLTREQFRFQGLNLTSTYRLKEWAAHIVDIQLEDGSYGLIINEDDLLCEISPENLI